MRKIWFALLAAALLATAHPAIAQAPAPPKVDEAKAAQLLAIGKDDRILGKPDAPVTIVEYGSLTCPHCAHFTVDVLPALKKKWIDTGKAKLVFRDYPLDQVALRAEMIARCAPPDRYYAMIDTLFANQDKWVKENGWQPALQRMVLLGGVSKKEFDACLANKAVEDKVANSRLVASQQLGVEATPTFFINGKKFEGEPTIEGLDQAVTAAAAKP